MPSHATLEHFILQTSMSLIDSIERMYVVYIDELTGGYQMLSRDNRPDAPARLVEGFRANLMKTTAQRGDARWLRDDELPIEGAASAIAQLGLFDDNQTRVLQLPLAGDDRQTRLVCFFVFPVHNPLFGLCPARPALSAENRALVAGMMANNLRQLRGFYQQEQLRRRRAQQLFDDTEAKLRGWYTENAARDALARQALGQVVRIVAQGHADATGARRAAVAEATIDEIAKLKLNMYEVKDLVENSLSSLHDIASTPAELMPWHLRVDMLPREAQGAAPGDEGNAAQGREAGLNAAAGGLFAKEYQWLEKMEAAAARVVAQGRSNVLRNLAAELETPVSAAAISDYLKKNRARVLKLFAAHPDRWPLLRERYKSFYSLADTDRLQGIG